MRMKIRALRRKKGQAIVEYATVIAFVCCVIALVVQVTRGSLFAGISDAYGYASGNLDKLNQAALAASH